MLICPICHHVLVGNQRSYQCMNRHCFDIAKSGYVNLWPGCHSDSGDDKEMVAARSLFLSTGFYEPFQAQLLKMVSELNPKVVADLGCGEGYYTNALQQTLLNVDVYGFDVSKAALQHASKQNRTVHYVMASLADIPLADNCVDVITDIFAPVIADSFKRILKPNGYFIKVGPGKTHLMNMKNVLYDQAYENDDAIIEYPGFIHQERIIVDTQFEIPNQELIQALFQMTPYYWKSPKATTEQLLSMNTLTMQAQFCFDLYRCEK